MPFCRLVLFQFPSTRFELLSYAKHYFYRNQVLVTRIWLCMLTLRSLPSRVVVDHSEFVPTVIPSGISTPLHVFFFFFHVFGVRPFLYRRFVDSMSHLLPRA